MYELDEEKRAWHDRRLDRIEGILDTNAVQIAENVKGIAELKASTVRLEVRLEEAMKWMPLKAGLWTVGILLSAAVGIAAIAAIPDAISIIMRFFGGG